MRITLVGQGFLFQRGRQDAYAQRFTQDQHVAGFCARVFLDARRVYQAHHNQAVNRLHRVDGVAAGDRDAGIAAHILAAAQDRAYGLQRQHIDGHADESKCHDGGAAHGVDVADGIGSGDTAKVVRVIDDGA